MEINTQIQKRAEARRCDHSICCARARPTAGARSRPPIQRARREAMATTAATRRSPNLILSQRELEALQSASPWRKSSTLLHRSRRGRAGNPRQEPSSGVRPKMRPQPFSAFQRPASQHEGRTLSPRPYYQRGDQVGAADKTATPRPTRAAHPLALPDLQESRAPS